MAAELTASQQCSGDPPFVASLSLPSLLDKLPLSLPVPADTPTSLKRHYRSRYVYLGYQDLLDPAAWSAPSPFDIALRLIDFSSIEGILAHMVYRPSPRGHKPFHPVSMFLLHSWRIDSKWNRAEVLRNLGKDCYDDYRQRFGFAKGVYPTEGGLRYFETKLGSQSGNDLIAQTVELARSIGCISEEAKQHGILGMDGMIHDAASRMRCSSVDDACYQPAPSPDTSRTVSIGARKCRAKEEKKRQGCDCDEFACAQVCKHATPRDPKARFVVYKGHNRTDSPNAPVESSPNKDKPPSGDPRYGYRTVFGRLVDRIYRRSWVLGDGLLSANAPEDKEATEQMKKVVSRYDWVQWEFTVADAGEGREPFLSTAYQLGLRRVVGLRADKSDAKVEEWAIRGYDDKGIPICPHGYRLHPNGWDSERRRFKWCCRRTCEQETECPAPDCPHRFDGDKHGLVRDVGQSFADGSTRLVRDVPYGSPFAKKLYAQARNAAEERNSEFQDLGLKRMPVYGWERVQAMVTVVDMWVNLNTIVRLIREATLAANGLSPP